MSERWTIEICADCGLPYCRKEDETYKSRCMPCYKTTRSWDLNQSDKALQATQVALKKAILRKNKVQAKLPKRLLRELMVLCHPDKHKGSQRATEVFQKLVDLKDKK